MIPRVYPILDLAAVAARGLDAVETAQALINGGAGILQFRHKGHWSPAIFETAQAICTMCAQAGAQFVVNDRADFARLLGAGLHVGQDDLRPALARRVLGSAATLGFSTHNPAQFQAALAEPVSYLAFGPIFATVSKENPDPVTGPAQLHNLVHNHALPVVAIGGITRANARQVWESGARAVAVISDLFPEAATPQSIYERMKEWLRLSPN